MNNFILFLVFSLIGFLSEIFFKIIILPLKFIKNKIVKNIIDVLHVCFLCLTFQIFVTNLNYGEFRAFFTISYIISIIIADKFIVNPLEKCFILLYNKIKEKHKCKKTES
jgi:hypothetical protein